MAELSELLEHARKLGEALLTHPRVQAFIAAQRAVQASEPAKRLLHDYQSQVERVRRLELERKPIEVADKQKLAEYEIGLASQDQLKQLMRAQADYLDLINQVNRAIEAPLMSAVGGPGVGPQGA